MATSTARTVKDVNPHDFVKAYSAHLKRSGKVAIRFIPNPLCLSTPPPSVRSFADDEKLPGYR
jgi:hypothetical protein